MKVYGWLEDGPIQPIYRDKTQGFRFKSMFLSYLFLNSVLKSSKISKSIIPNGIAVLYILISETSLKLFSTAKSLCTHPQSDIFAYSYIICTHNRRQNRVRETNRLEKDVEVGLKRDYPFYISLFYFSFILSPLCMSISFVSIYVHVYIY